MTEEDFQNHVLANLTKAEDHIRYHFARLRELISQNGAVSVAKMFVTIDETFEMRDGFQILVEHGVEHWSLEQAMVDFADAPFFEPQDIAAAQAKLLYAAIRRRAKARR